MSNYIITMLALFVVILVIIAISQIIKDCKNIKSCKNCKYLGNDDDRPPCLYCYDFEEWEKK